MFLSLFKLQCILIIGRACAKTTTLESLPPSPMLVIKSPSCCISYILVNWQYPSKYFSRISRTLARGILLLKKTNRYLEFSSSDIYLKVCMHNRMYLLDSQMKHLKSRQIHGERLKNNTNFRSILKT